MLIRRSGTQIIGERSAATLPGEVDLARASDFELGALHAQPSTLQLRFGGESRTIEPRVMQVLVLLANERGKVVSRDQLIECCWSGRAVSEDAINRAIAKVRRIGEEAKAFEIETIPRVGYRLMPDRGEVVAAAKSSRAFGRPLLLVALLVMAVSLAAGAFWYFRGTSAPQQPSVAILPFTPLDGDLQARNVSESIRDTITNALAQTGARIPEGKISTSDDARRAGAQIIISGTVRHSGAAIVITTRVDSARAGATLLSKEFSGDLSTESQVEGHVAAWLIPPVRLWASFLTVEPDPAVTDGILRVFLTRTGGDFLRARKLAHALAAAKPRSGSAQFVYALLTSDVLSMMAPDQRRAEIQSARGAALDATHLLAKPERVTAVLECHLTAPGWHVLTPKCDAATRAAISADPDIPVVPFLFGMELNDTGRFVEAAKFIDIDLASNPLGPPQIATRLLSTRMMRGGQDPELVNQLKDRMQRYVHPLALTDQDFAIALANGDFAAADRLLNDPEVGPIIAVGDARTITGLALRAVKSRAPADVAAMRNGCNSPEVGWAPAEPAFETCLVAMTQLGDLDGVLALATRGYRDVACCSPAQQEAAWLASGGDYYDRWPLFGKALAPLRADRRFIEIARRTGLLAYWKSGHPPDFCSFERAPVCELLSGR